MSDQPKNVKIQSKQQGKVPVDVRVPGWARQHPEVIDHAIALAKSRVEQVAVLAHADLAFKSAVVVALIETWFAGASDRRDCGPLEPHGEALAQTMAADTMASIGALMSLGAVATLMRRVACIVEERAAAELEPPRGRLDS